MRCHTARLLACLALALCVCAYGVFAYGVVEERLIGWQGEVARDGRDGSVADSYVTLPSGWHMPRLGFGTAGLGSRTEEAVSAALAAGYRLIDTAQAGEWYREDSVGAALHKSAVRREQVFITTKIHPRHLGYDVTTARIRVSLRALDTHYLDLLLLHYPECWGNLCDGMQPAGTWKESWRALEAAHREGTVRSLGVSNFDAGQVRELLAWAQVPPSVVQAGSDPYASNAVLRAVCREHGIAFVGYSTLGTQWWGRGYHSGNPVLEARPVVQAASAHGVSPAQVALRWALQQGQCVIPRSADAAHMAANRRLDFVLTPDELAAIDALDGTVPNLTQEV